MKVHVAPIAAVPEVTLDDKIWDRITTSGQRDVLGAEMEGVAIGLVRETEQVERAILVKGVQDFARMGKDRRFRAFGSEASAEFLFRFLKHVLPQRRGGPPIGYGVKDELGETTRTGGNDQCRSLRDALSERFARFQHLCFPDASQLPGSYGDAQYARFETTWRRECPGGTSRLNPLERLVLWTALRLRSCGAAASHTNLLVIERAANDIEDLAAPVHIEYWTQNVRGDVCKQQHDFAIFDMAVAVAKGSSTTEELRLVIEGELLTVRQQLLFAYADVAAKLALSPEGLALAAAEAGRLRDRFDVARLQDSAPEAFIGFVPSARAFVMQVAASRAMGFEVLVLLHRSTQTAMEKLATVLAAEPESSRPTLRSYAVTLLTKVGFVPEVLRFAVDAQLAINTLVGRHLYDDQAIVLRELVQNAMDACNLRGGEEGYAPQIMVSYSEKDGRLVVQDNGIGMTLGDIRSRLLVGCTSGFRDYGRGDLIAKFGIGFLSTFIGLHQV